MKTKYTALLMVTVSDYSLKVYIYIYTTLGRQLVYSSLDYCFNFDKQIGSSVKYLTMCRILEMTKATSLAK